jgi:uncharacterized protein (TIGR01777 family)
MRIIVTGGTGMIGRALTASLAADGHEVIILTRSPGQVRGMPANVRAAAWDGASADGWGELADGATAIVNLASENIGGERFIPDRWTAERKRSIRQSRIDAGHAVVEAVKNAAVKPQVVVQISGTDYYGNHDSGRFTESDPPGDSFLASVAVDWEASTTPVEDYGVRRPVLRSGAVLTTQGGMLTRVLFPYRFFVGGPLGSGRQWWSWIHLDDLVRAIRFAVEQPGAHGPINVVAPENLQNRDFGKTVARVLGRPHYFPIPGLALRAALGEVATLVLDGRYVIPKRLQEMGFEFQFPTLEAALRDLIQRGR